ncbi:MAG: hypothetical protein ACK5LR_03515 [Mangrovibacterium sp.]
MEQENQTPTSNTSFTPNRRELEEVREKSKKLNLIVIILAVVLAAVIVLFIIQYNKSNKLNQFLNAQKTELQTELASMVANYDTLKTANDTLNLRLYSAQSEVKDLLEEMNQVKKTSYAQISKYQKEIGSLREIMRNYVVQVDSLNQRNKILMAENAQVKQDYAKIQNKNQRLEKQKEELSQVVKQASQLEARNIVVLGLNSRGKETANGSRAEQLQIQMNLSKNLTAKRGAKSVYVRILRPDQVLLVPKSGGTFRYEDLDIPYSAAREVTYEGNELPLNIYWNNEGFEPFMEGNYTIDVFADGDNIGTTTFSFKR